MSIPAPNFPGDCFALLDDCEASSADPRSRLYTTHTGTLSCKNAGDLPALLERMQQALRQGQYAVGLFSYELGAAMQGIADRSFDHPLAEILLFECCNHMSAQQLAAWLTDIENAPGAATASRTPDTPAGIARVHASVDEARFNAAIARIHAYLEAGDSYQINYTYRLHFDAFGSALALYRKLRERQPVPFGAFVNLPDGRTVLSLSPEQFVRNENGTATARPMKGTAAASGDARQDAVRAAALATDPKNRAENLMIVDLLRNDLGRIAIPGSVQVPAMFEVTRYGDLLQMTSTVKARMRADVTLHDMLVAMYPCGSITGAPKRRSMQIIRELETDPRGLYTGAIGWFDAPAGDFPIGDFCLSIPIRTLDLDAPGTDGVRLGGIGIGAGIVHDSIAADEYAECKMKAGFLTGLPNDFELFETMHATRDGGCRNLDLHLQRLRSSAEYFGFAYDETHIHAALKDAFSGLSDSGSYRLRLALKQSGICNLKAASLQLFSEPVNVLLSPTVTHADDLFLRHKTSVRTRYDAAWREAESQGGFDMLFFNTDGELTEGSRSNVFVMLDGRWYTPPLSAGVLPGIMRKLLLDDPAWGAQERRLTLADLRGAEQVVVCNALRGAMHAKVLFPAS